MIGKMIHGLETIREHFLLKDCKKMLKKYYGKKAAELGEKYGKDADRLIDKYSGSTIAMRVLAHTIELIESYDKEAFEKQMADFERMLKDALAKKNAPDGAATPSQGK